VWLRQRHSGQGSKESFMHRIALVLEVIANAWSQRVAAPPKRRARARTLPPFEVDFAEETLPGAFYTSAELAPKDTGAAERHFGATPSLPS
jgi:hypothetical protein